MSPVPPPRFADLCAVARRRSRAARLTLQEVPGGEVEAEELIRTAWSCLLQAARVAEESAPPSASTPDDTSAKDPAPKPESAPDAANDDELRDGDDELCDTKEDSTEDDTEPPRPSLLLEAPDDVTRFFASPEPSSDAAIIGNAIDYVDRCLEQLQRDTQRWSLYKRPLQAFAAVALLTLTCAAGYAAYRAFGPDVWLARIYPKLQFEGKPARTSYRNLEQDWGRGDVVPGIRSEGFSARFDSCLRLERPTKVKFWLQSKEGSNLYVDGRKVVANWNMAKDPVAKSKAIQLDAGVHHLSVDYFNQVGQAALRLRASFDDGSLSLLDHRRLEAPIAWPDQVPAKGKKGKVKVRVCAD